MTVDHMTMDQVRMGLMQIESVAKTLKGEVDLMLLSRNKELFSTWRKLRERLRAEHKSLSKV